MDLTVKAKIKHDGKWFEPGDSLKKVKKEDRERLVELGAAVEDGKKDSKEQLKE